ncbi:regulatory protein ArsR [Ferroglobus placidus DSM 10642]|uniref:Regulatory protein ArsR n=1 Tax=Ferroglobus placidus (strain DSM 10642 / AEDII12DO) TaxID=589924 RepID=D3S0A9_FERPA|nr:HTH domain-containing protein [Ferroglobus placidus]ADC66172.1 regulatory protein ArsR [Ferroglobus placidus DSM 10642]
MVKLRIEIGRRDSREELLEVARRIDEGEDVEFERIVFESYEALRKILTPERLKILHVIKEKNPKSVYELAKLLGRNRRNVIKDLEILEMLGLVKFVEEKKGKRRRKVPVVPYDEIEVSIPVVSCDYD